MPSGGRATKRPVTVVTGFLGSGKTTLLSRVLTDPSMSDTAVLVNEFGKVGLDHHLLRRADEKTVLLGHGCVCCSTRDDLIEALSRLLDEEDRGEIQPLNRVVVETTGLADPAPILYTVFSHTVLQHHYRVDRVICTVDTANGRMHLDRNPESTKQIAAADVVVLTKTDMPGVAPVDELRARIHGINPSARVLEAPFGTVEPSELFGVHAPSASWGEFRLPEADGPSSRYNASDAAPDSGHVSQTHSSSLTFDGPVDWTAFGVWLSMLLHARGEDVLRVKGLLDVGEAGPVLINGVQHVIYPPDHLDGWPDDDHRSRIVFITRGIPAEEVVTSLKAFSAVIGARPQPLETGLPV